MRTRSPKSCDRSGAPSPTCRGNPAGCLEYCGVARSCSWAGRRGARGACFLPCFALQLSGFCPTAGIGDSIEQKVVILTISQWLLLRLAAAGDEEGVEEKSDGPEGGNSDSDDDKDKDKDKGAEDADKEAMMSAYAGRRSRRYLAPVLEPGSRRSLAELPQQFSVSQKLRGFIS